MHVCIYDAANMSRMDEPTDKPILGVGCILLYMYTGFEYLLTLTKICFLRERRICGNVKMGGNKFISSSRRRREAKNRRQTIVVIFLDFECNPRLKLSLITG